ncbi:HRDC domain-containing protein, partial [Candidatus Accumulibacter vicinus]|uniref:HRDC domain-containing protein n=1 Tax=Candidatus Accumulibacter vicinus TaxID=2954382 RepID=UPI00055467DE
MTMHFFTAPALNPQPAQDELNRFCASHRVVGIERRLVAAGANSYWVLCVTVSAGAGVPPDALKTPERKAGARAEAGTAAARVDYRQVLSEQDFAVYADLRVWRKAVAEQEGVPVYAVFTNEQLAEIVRRRVDHLAALGEIEGVGPARLERYGEAVLNRPGLSPLPELDGARAVDAP